MKKIMKMSLALLAAFAVTLASAGNEVYAATGTGGLESYRLAASLRKTDNSATGSTYSTGCPVAVSVETTLVCYCTDSNRVVRKISKTSGGMGTAVATVTNNDSSEVKSVSAVSRHYACYGASTWSAMLLD